MQERLQEILTNERLTPARFAELVGVQRSSVSHILSGRNKPSLDFLQKTLDNFEHVNPDWLISGKGPYKRPRAPEAQKAGSSSQPNKAVSGRIDFPASVPAREEERAGYGNKAPAPDTGISSSLESENNTTNGKESSSPKADSGKEPKDTLTAPTKEKEVIKTILFYNDNTFEIFFPA